MVLGTQPKQGTHKAYKFMTVCIVHNGIRFTLKALPLSSYSAEYEVFERLLKHAMNKIKVRRVYLDRGFYDVRIIRILKELELKDKTIAILP